MYKYIIIGVFLFALTWNAEAQNRKALANDITNQMSFIKKGHLKRQIEFRDSIWGAPLFETLSKKNITKDSLRHLLVDIGYNDFNFERFDFKVKKLNELNETFVKRNTPQLTKLLANSAYNKVTYSFQESEDGIHVSLIIAENSISFDDEKQMFVELLAGNHIRQEITINGYSKNRSITYCDDESYTNLTKKSTNKQNVIQLDEFNRFKITIDFSHKTGINAATKYIAIRNLNGEICSIIRL